jgi:hypothetical protein
VTSRRKRKQVAQAEGLTAAELRLCDLLEEVLAALQWQQVLGYGNQFLVTEKLQVTADERDRVMRAAAEAVAKDGRIQDWTARLQSVRQELQGVQERMRLRLGGKPAAGSAASAAEAAGG